MTKQTSPIENTTKIAQEFPAVHLTDAIVRGPAGSIENMEKRGTQQLAEASVLPVLGTLKPMGADNHQRPVWEALGVVFGDVLEDDPLFVNVTLPEGWKVVTTAHAMWNNLVDARGAVRGSMFYKAAFYDRSAHIFPPNTRYHIETEYRDDDGKFTRFVVKDRQEPDRVMFATEWRDDARAIGRRAAEAWIDRNFPKHADPLAYWDK
jgi:hypothetical protein